MSAIVDLLRERVNRLEQALQRGARHGCRQCIFYSCGGLGKCSCYCGQIGKERALHLEEMRYLLECAETGEVPDVQEPIPSGEPADSELGPSDDAKKRDDALDVLFDRDRPVE